MRTGIEVWIEDVRRRVFLFPGATDFTIQPLPDARSPPMRGIAAGSLCNFSSCGWKLERKGLWNLMFLRMASGIR